MRIGVSSGGRWWVTMGPLGWLLYLVFALPVLAACCLLAAVIWLCVLACRAIAGHRAAARGTC